MKAITKITLKKLPPECDYGCTEYKRQLTDVSEERRDKLVAQMLWRIHEGGGWCIYFIGVKNNGEFWNNNDDFLSSVIELNNIVNLCGARIIYELPIAESSQGFIIQREDYNPHEFHKMFRHIE